MNRGLRSRQLKFSQGYLQRLSGVFRGLPRTLSLENLTRTFSRIADTEMKLLLMSELRKLNDYRPKVIPKNRPVREISAVSARNLEKEKVEGSVDKIKEESETIGDKTAEEKAEEALAKEQLIDNAQTGFSQRVNSLWSEFRLAMILVSWLVTVKILVELMRNDRNGLGDISQGEKQIKPSTSTYRFEDVKGCDEVLREVREFLAVISSPDLPNKLNGMPLPRGLLLVGDPGLGKTLLAKAIAGEAGLPFFALSSSDFSSPFAGGEASNIRKAFAKAREYAPCVLFIDEIDSIGLKRNSSLTSHSRQTMNQILAEMDGFKSTERVFVVGATNHLQSLDEALLRPGRFDSILEISPPDLHGRRELFELYLSKISIPSRESALELARKTIGKSGAYIENVVNLAAQNSIKRQDSAIGPEDFSFALDRVNIGLTSQQAFKDFTPLMQKVAALHQVSQIAMAFLSTDKNLTFSKTTILPIGEQLGATSFSPKVSEILPQKQTVLDSIDLSLAPAVAENLVFGPKGITSACSGFLKEASRKSANFFLGNLDETKFFQSYYNDISEAKRNDIENSVETLMRERSSLIEKKLKANMPAIMKLTQELIARETMTFDEVQSFIKLNKIKFTEA